MTKPPSDPFSFLVFEGLRMRLEMRGIEADLKAAAARVGYDPDEVWALAERYYARTWLDWEDACRLALRSHRLGYCRVC